MPGNSKRRAVPEGAATVPSEHEGFFVPRLEAIVETEAGEPTRAPRAKGRSVVVDGCIRIGSHESNDLVLADPRVSRFHCRVERGARAWEVSDDDSLNGTYVAGVRVWRAELAMPECRLSLGDSTVCLRELPSTAQPLAHHRDGLGAIRGRSMVMQKLFEIIDRVSKSDANVLVEGESGTGKELVAGEIVSRGARATRPFVVVDCGAISPNLIESQLFGHARGAFTGALQDRAGAFEAADGGTIFLDEIGELPLEMQPKLLRALQAREVCRVGETRQRSIDVRVIAATNRHLEREVNRGRFREDLFFRLSVVTVRVPSLRDRLDDLGLLVDAFLGDFNAVDRRHFFTPALFEELSHHDWPGNVRELRNYVERAIVLEDMTPRMQESGSQATEADALNAADGPPPAPVDLDVPFNEAKAAIVRDFERKYLAALLAWSGGNVSKAARRAQMDRMNLHRLLQMYGAAGARTLRD